MESKTQTQNKKVGELILLSKLKENSYLSSTNKTSSKECPSENSDKSTEEINIFSMASLTNYLNMRIQEDEEKEKEDFQMSIKLIKINKNAITQKENKNPKKISISSPIITNSKLLFEELNKEDDEEGKFLNPSSNSWKTLKLKAIYNHYNSII